MDNTNISERLIELRKNKGLTQKELANELNYSDKVISKWERGESLPNIVALKDLADFYEVTTDEILGLKSDNKEVVVNKKLKSSILKGPSKVMMFSFLYPLVLLIPAFIFENFELFTLTVFLFAGYLMVYSFLLARISFYTEYKGHVIKVVNRVNSCEMFVDNQLVDGNYQLFALGVSLTAKIGKEKVKTRFSFNFFPRCEFFVE